MMPHPVPSTSGRSAYRVVAAVLLFLPLLVAAPLANTALAGELIYHTVAWGETLYSIARHYDTDARALAILNGLNLDSLVLAGQVIKVASPNHDGPPQRDPTPAGYYTVRAGDTLLSIAERFSSDPLELALLNNIPPNGFIYVGWKLKLPPKSAGAQASGGSAEDNRKAAPLSSQSYIVQEGDTLASIALGYNTTPQAIAIANSLSTTWLVAAGQRLAIPTRAPRPAANPSPPSGASAEVAASAPALSLRLADVPLFRQQQSLTCEEAAAAMAARGSITERALVRVMPRSDNPFTGIRGATNSPTLGGLTDYGAYAPALQRGLSALGRDSTVLYGQAYADFQAAILANLRAGRPVVWWNTWHESFQSPVLAKTASGASVRLVPYEHTVVIVGATDRGVTYHDPYDATIRTISWSTHRRVSFYFGNMGLVLH